MGDGTLEFRPGPFPVGIRQPTILGRCKEHSLGFERLRRRQIARLDSLPGHLNRFLQWRLNLIVPRSQDFKGLFCADPRLMHFEPDLLSESDVTAERLLQLRGGDRFCALILMKDRDRKIYPWADLEIRAGAVGINDRGHGGDFLACQPGALAGGFDGQFSCPQVGTIGERIQGQLPGAAPKGCGTGGRISEAEAGRVLLQAEKGSKASACQFDVRPGTHAVLLGIQRCDAGGRRFQLTEVARPEPSLRHLSQLLEHARRFLT